MRFEALVRAKDAWQPPGIELLRAALRNRNIVPVRSTGASEAIQKLGPVISALQQAGFVVDCTVEGLMHAAETPEILKAGARILVISNEHPEALERPGSADGVFTFDLAAHGRMS